MISNVVAYILRAYKIAGALGLAFITYGAVLNSFVWGTMGAFLFGLTVSISMLKIALKKEEQALSDGGIMQTPLRTLTALMPVFAGEIREFIEALHRFGESSEELIERYEMLTEHMAAGIVIKDANGEITYCNPFVEVLTGYSIREIYSCKEDFFVHIAEREEDRERLRTALRIAQLGDAFVFRHRFKHKSGMVLWAEQRVVPVLSERGDLKGIVSVLVDVTANVRKEEQITAQNRDLQDFAYMLSHDLKSPLFTIKGMNSVLKDEIKDKVSEEALTAINHIDRAVERLEKLVSAIIEYSEITSRDVKSAKILFSEVINEVLADLDPLIEEAGGECNVEIKSDEILGDRTALYQILVNLVGNAVKYRDSKRKLKVDIKCEAKSLGRETKIIVSDTGLGIPKERLNEIFRPFNRVHTSKQGFGVGLACVQKLVYKMGGEIKVYSQEGVGSTFDITLPN